MQFERTEIVSNLFGLLVTAVVVAAALRVQPSLPAQQPDQDMPAIELSLDTAEETPPSQEPAQPTQEQPAPQDQTTTADQPPQESPPDSQEPPPDSTEPPQPPPPQELPPPPPPSEAPVLPPPPPPPPQPEPPPPVPPPPPPPKPVPPPPKVVAVPRPRPPAVVVHRHVAPRPKTEAAAQPNAAPSSHPSPQFSRAEPRSAGSAVQFRGCLQAHSRYPTSKEARLENPHGVVGVSVSLAGGAIVGVNVISSSGSPILDAAARESVLFSGCGPLAGGASALTGRIVF